jgi:hypothetical protein
LIIYFLPGYWNSYYYRDTEVTGLTLLLPDSNFKRRCVRHNILTVVNCWRFEARKSTVRFGNDVGTVHANNLNVPVFLYSDSWLIGGWNPLAAVSAIYMQCICHEIQWILPKIDNFISTNTFCFIHQIIFTIHIIQSNIIFLNINLQYFVFC